MKPLDAALFNPSGGVTYHVSAWRWRKTHWLPFVSALETWLTEEWNPQETSLVLFGPSAGWTLSKDFLSRFETVLAIEPDPVARFLLRRRFPDVHWKFDARTTLLPWFAPDGSEFEHLLASHSKSALLFSNLLGQVPLLMQELNIAETDSGDEAERFETIGLRKFLPALQGRSWASYHDVISTSSVFDCFSSHAEPGAALDAGSRSKASPGVEPLAHQFFAPGTEVLDHQTLWLKTKNPTLYLPWNLKPDASHVIGCVRS